MVIMSMLMVILSSVIMQIVYLNELMQTRTIAFDNLSISVDFFETQIRTHETIKTNTSRLLEVSGYDGKSHYFLYSTQKNGSICFGSLGNYLSQNIKQVNISNNNSLITIHIQADINNELHNMTRQIYVDHNNK